MNVSSSEVIDAVAAEIKHYMDVTRKEDGFDLSGPYEPKRSYPQNKMAPILSYGKLQDRSLKHYFTPSMIRTHIANLEAVPPGSPREKTVRYRLNRKMKQYTNNDIPQEVSHVSKKLSEELYKAQLQALSVLHAETQSRLRRKVIQGPPVLRRSIHPKMTHGEAVRLVNRSSQILVATETVALAHDILAHRDDFSLRPQSAPSSWSNGLPGLYYSPERPKTARGRTNNKMYASTPKTHKTPKYVWDINGRRVLNDDYEETIEDDPSSSYSVSTSSIEIDAYGRRHKRLHRRSRPMSAMALPHNSHVSYSGRPFSAGEPQMQEHFSRPVSRKMFSPDSGFSVDAVTQTRYRQRPNRRIRQAFISGSERSSEDDVKLCKYRAEIRTGDRLGAGTTADIYLSLHGDDAETDEIYLTNPISKDKKSKPFKRGQTDIFEIEAENVGDLRKIGIGHDHKEKGSSWFLDSVKIKNDKQSWLFHCKTWLSGSMSKRKTFRHFLLDHSSSESSESDSSDVTTSSSDVSEVKPKKIVRRKSSTASSISSRSSRSSKSRFSSGGDFLLTNAPPSVSVQPPTPTSSGHTLVEQNDPLHHFSSESSKSSLEYSSDSTLGGGRKVKENESFLEESEDTLSHLTTTTSGSDTLTDSAESEKEEKKSTADPGVFKNPFSVDGLFSSKREERDSFSSSSSSVSSVVSSKLDQKSLQKLSSSSGTSSDDLDSSSSSSEEEQKTTPDPPRKLVKQFSSTVPLTVKPESSKFVSSSPLVSADVTTTEDPTEYSAVVTDHEVLKSPIIKDESSSSSSSSDEEESLKSSSVVSSVVKEAIVSKSSSSSSSDEEDLQPSGVVSSSDLKEVVIPKPRRLSLAESVSIRTESVSELPDTFLDAAVKEVTGEAVEDEVEITEKSKLSLESGPLSRRSSSSSSSSQSSVSSSSSDERDITAENIGTNDGIKTKDDARLSEDETRADEKVVEFETGDVATKRLSLTNPLLLEEEAPKTYDIDESLQSDEEGIIQSPSHPTIRGDVHNLIKEGETDKVIEIITLRPELLEKTNENGWSPIHVAATHGKIEILQWLTAKHANLKAETPTGYTAMHMATMHGHVECVRILYAMGAQIDATNVDDQTPLHLACMSGHLETAKWLVANGADLHARDNFQRTALDLSKQYHHNDVTLFLKTRLHELKQNSSESLLRSSKSSIESKSSSSSSSSSEDDDEKPSDWKEDLEVENDKVAEIVSHKELEEKKRMYEKQQKKMVRRRSSFLDVIRVDAQNEQEKSTSSDSESSSSSSN